MDNKNIGILGDTDFLQGAYNISPSFLEGLFKGLKNIHPNTYYINSREPDIGNPFLLISLGILGLNVWEKYLNSDTILFNWKIDNIFRNNDNVLKQYTQYKNYIMGAGTLFEIEPLQFFYPNANFIYFPIATDPEVWKPDKNAEKIYDIVLMSTIFDIEDKIEKIKENTNPRVFKFFKDFLDLFISNSEMSIWHLYHYYCSIIDFNPKNYMLYNILVHEILYLATYIRRINLVKNLKKYNLRIWGSPEWEKYIEGNVKYMGVAPMAEAIKITQQAKIVLNLQQMQSQLALPERILNSMATGAVVFSDNNIEIEKYFPDTVVYYNNQDFEDIKEKLNYYLSNDEALNDLSAKGRQAIIDNHTWGHRAKYLMNVFFNAKF